MIGLHPGAIPSASQRLEAFFGGCFICQISLGTKQVQIDKGLLKYRQGLTTLLQITLHSQLQADLTYNNVHRACNLTTCVLLS